MIENSIFKYHKIIELSQDQKDMILAECTGQHEQEKDRILAECTDSLADYKKRKAFLAQIEKPEGRSEQIAELVYLHCIKIAFDVMIANSINL